MTEPSCTCSYEESEEMTAHAALCAVTKAAEAAEAVRVHHAKRMHGQVRHAARHVKPLLAQTGRRYPNLEFELERLSPEALRDLQRLLRDREADLQAERNKRRRGQFW